ncbi:hypothetical protein PsYK624_111050 [Phanerochaete sordida]|uniref:Uncharacterized protein n=1 Tax=Phanerochaete sordida TaxID=48140 RepID=A0A9P3LHR7_9APHY|nr:hypothetical protein PsYK624_111050 [Phanerochaete sordida]
MPKATSPRKTPRSPAKSPSKSKAAAPVATDGSTWRASRIRIHETINKTAAMKLYRLTAGDLAKLSFEIKAPDAGRPANHQPTHLYNEREVEKTAWRKYGGPEGFEAHLVKLKARHAERWPDCEFPTPNAYQALSAGPAMPVEGDEWTVTPGLAQIKKRMPEWMWAAYNAALDDIEMYGMEGPRGITYRAREAAMKAALTFVGEYPTRPDEVLPSSRSVVKLRAVLARAPAMGSDGEDMKSHFDGFTGDVTYFWSDDFTEELFEALITVIEKRGIEGWEHVRWEVYDKYRECLPGISYDIKEKRWTDDAIEWLCGRLHHHPRFLSTRRCEYTDAGRQYNRLLPRLPFGRHKL